jgi:hypothetical protein
MPMGKGVLFGHLFDELIAGLILVRLKGYRGVAMPWIPIDTMQALLKIMVAVKEQRQWQANHFSQD